MRIYIEVDNVLNAAKCYKAWPGVVDVLEVEEVDVGSGAGEGLTWSAEMVDRLKSLRDVGKGIEIVWVSTWGSGCRQIARLMGIGEWAAMGRVLTPLSGDYTFPSIYWKAEAVWADLKYYGGAWAWFDAGVEVLWEHPDYKDLLQGENGFVPEFAGDVGITPEILLGLEIRMENEEWT